MRLQLHLGVKGTQTVSADFCQVSQGSPFWLLLSVCPSPGRAGLAGFKASRVLLSLSYNLVILGELVRGTEKDICSAASPPSWEIHDLREDLQEGSFCFPQGWQNVFLCYLPSEHSTHIHNLRHKMKNQTLQMQLKMTFIMESVGPV